jgi:hypothetical protein
MWDVAKRMSRPNVIDYNLTHISHYPDWTLDRLRLDPRYADGLYNISNGEKLQLWLINLLPVQRIIQYRGHLHI